MSSSQTLVCVKKVKQEVVEEWDESMPLPGDIIEGVAKGTIKDDNMLFIQAKGRSEFSSQLGKISKKADDDIWLMVRRGDSMVNLHVAIVPERGYKLHRWYTVRAASNDKHIAVLAELTFDECTELQGRFLFSPTVITKCLASNNTFDLESLFVTN